MVLVFLALGGEDDEIAWRDHLGVHHARLGAAQAGVHPLHGLDLFHCDAVRSDVQPLRQVRQGGVEGQLLAVHGSLFLLGAIDHPLSIGVVGVGLVPHLEQYLVAGRYDREIAHARLGAAQAAIGPFDLLDRQDGDPVGRCPQHPAQV